MGKVIKVRYVVRPEYASENKKRISEVMKELKASSDGGITYFVSVKNNDNFMHIVRYTGGADESLPASLPTFKHFQEGLKGNVVISPKVEEFSFVDSND